MLDISLVDCCDLTYIFGDNGGLLEV